MLAAKAGRPLVAWVATQDIEVRQLARAERSKIQLGGEYWQTTKPESTCPDGGNCRPDKDMMDHRYLFFFFHSVSNSVMTFQSTVLTSGT